MSEKDRVQREIEDILNRLDNFVPERSVTSSVRKRPPGFAGRVLRTVVSPITGISLSQVMLTALALIVLSFFAMRIHPIFARWAIVAGLILFFTSLALSFFTRGAKTTERQWRGRTIEFQEPGLADRLRAWLRSRRRPPS